jgi:type IV pilus assembly protein PilE
MKLQAKGGMRGFTLVELMVVVVIASILLAVAVPSYMSQIRQSRRTDARTAVLDLAGREERYFSTNASRYTAAPADLGYGGAGWPTPVGSGYYQVTVCSPACAPSALAATAPAAPSFTVIAVPVAGSSQANDTPCQGFAVDSTGAQFAETGGTWAPANPANASAADCWAH